MLRRAVAAFVLALQFLTVVRLRRRLVYDERTLGASLAWFPAAGFLVGVLLAGADWLCEPAVGSAVAVAIVLALNAAVTGALHLDGLADTADGVFGGHTPERRLEIMKDSHTGSFGVVAVTLALLLAYTSLWSLPALQRRELLLVAPMLARTGMVIAIVAFPYARPAGLGRAYKDHAKPPVVVGAAVLSFLLAAAVLGLWGVALGAISICVTVAIGWLLSRRLHGLTGDTYGAIAVLVEVVLFIAGVMQVKHEWLPG